MNGVAHRCQAVLVLAKEGSGNLGDEELVATRGYHCACSIMLDRAESATTGLEAAVKKRVRAFCESSPALQTRFMDAEAVQRNFLSGDDRGGAVKHVSAPLTVLDARAQDAMAVVKVLGDIHATPGAVSTDERGDARPYCLVAVADLTRWKAVSPARAEESNPLAWLRPTQSYLSEHLRAAARDNFSDDDTVLLFPLHMYCTRPMVRDTGYGADADVLDSSNVCTLEGILRELGYKAGYLPKYGA